ncbi:SH3 domain-containing protein [Massilia norwichensis]|uniref:SH3 domain-containing protein n=1 Tax=Massilia norwichensis TaxID=1442366 RepID=A0ABT2A916_9BURK|nr:SH3 domain-containing protein [Massilia norwichensis]MCS0590679.1 SH3 domain-containing protein [Massilia norwichensis]
MFSAPFRHGLLAGSILMLASCPAFAFDFKTVGPRSVVLYDAPSAKGGKLFIAPSGMPVEVVLSYGEWVKVRDASGDMAWAEARGLSAKRNVIVRVAGARVRAAPEDNAAVLMTADKNVLLELVDPEAGPWVRVRHRDGISGYIRASEVWGI